MAWCWTVTIAHEKISDGSASCSCAKATNQGGPNTDAVQAGRFSHVNLIPPSTGMKFNTVCKNACKANIGGWLCGGVQALG